MHEPPALAWQLYIDPALASGCVERLPVVAEFSNEVPIELHHGGVAINLRIYISDDLKRTLRESLTHRFAVEHRGDLIPTSFSFAGSRGTGRSNSKWTAKLSRLN